MSNQAKKISCLEVVGCIEDVCGLECSPCLGENRGILFAVLVQKLQSLEKVGHLTMLNLKLRVALCGLGVELFLGCSDQACYINNTCMAPPVFNCWN